MSLTSGATLCSTHHLEEESLNIPPGTSTASNVCISATSDPHEQTEKEVVLLPLGNSTPSNNQTSLSITANIPEETFNTPSENTASFSAEGLKKGDILFFPVHKSIHVITRVDGSEIWIGTPEFSINNEPGTWALSGPDIYWTPFSERQGLFLDPKCPPEELLDTSSETPLVNPSGVIIRQKYFDDGCPWGNCCGGFFCPGCGGVSRDFDYLFMSCGTLMACPVCHGQGFAEYDKGYLKELEEVADRLYGRYQHGQSNVDAGNVMTREELNRKIEEATAGIWKERCEWIDERRKELELPPIKWE